jgi:hypothetical protein
MARRKLEKIRVKEISLVDKPATGRRFMFVKSQQDDHGIIEVTVADFVEAVVDGIRQALGAR